MCHVVVMRDPVNMALIKNLLYTKKSDRMFAYFLCIFGQNLDWAVCELCQQICNDFYYLMHFELCFGEV